MKGFGGYTLATTLGMAVMPSGASAQATTYTCTASSGSDCFKVQTSGARVHFGAGTNDYATSNGSVVTFASNVASNGNIGIGAAPFDMLSIQGGGPAISLLNSNLPVNSRRYQLLINGQGIFEINKMRDDGSGVQTECYYDFYSSNPQMGCYVPGVFPSLTANGLVAIVDPGAPTNQKNWWLNLNGNHTDLELRLVNDGNFVGTTIMKWTRNGITPVSVTITGDTLPSAANTYSLGSSSQYYLNVYSKNYPTVSSDARLKKDVKDLRYGLAELLKLRPVTYKWKEGADDGSHIGLIAQEVEKVLPDAVVHGAEVSDPLGIRYDALLPVLVRGLQQQEATIERLDAELAALRKSKEVSLSSLWPWENLGGLSLGLAPLAWMLGRARGRRDESKA